MSVHIIGGYQVITKWLSYCEKGLPHQSRIKVGCIGFPKGTVCKCALWRYNLSLAVSWA
jgi:hypothetical protein